MDGSITQPRQEVGFDGACIECGAPEPVLFAASLIYPVQED